ncbi:YveK family protein [Paenibacillus flagellatus]|uniref:Lipopolysaccharide biosynthesis protein n=1 Tax=Paenibacillus flagellatus TaxID=2211139 RepID=A0A2V5KC82_9BACL|nr:Wzz/FepE/Etk N-terminal domain-containing protein [Paenibacillus flagellatus]PYI57205.1 lipopolysaccharide biosynthesis protein [Paenibacillus flagellatus]
MEMELRDYFSIVRRRIWLILSLVLAVSLFAAAIQFFVLKPVYAASVRLVVNEGSQMDLNAITTNIKLVTTYKEIIKTPAIMSKVVERHPELNLTTEQLIAKTEVTAANESQMLTLTIEDGSYEKAVSAVHALAGEFKTEIARIMKVDNVTILESDTIPGNNPSPIKPKIQLNMLMAIALSLFLSAGLVLLIEYLDDTIKTDKQAELILGMPVLASISRIRKKDLYDLKSGAQNHRKVGETHYASLNQ